MYAAQEIPQVDAEIAQKGHFRMETNLLTDILLGFLAVFRFDP